ncbi:MAG TPA: hypothetical protein VG102_01200 [Candidatus Paceibacterota bacterium]|jgi:hypothetical protein|nr:hypothetical protein [Candidatus Paceibacterota bacterium]
MNKIKTIIAGSIGTLLVAAPASALTVTAAAGVNVNAGSTTVSANVQTKIATAKNRADQEITRRINSLTDLNTKVQAMVKVSSSEKGAISSEVQTEISNLTSLKTKIDADTDIATLRTDITSITQDYRIFMLVIPQGRIEVAADRIETVVSSYAALSTKLQARISQAPSGTDTTQVNAWLSDMNAKAADANTQVQAAVSLVANLQPDQGNASVAASNKTALQSARADIKAALTDLRAARQDAGSIVKAVESWKVSASASSTVNSQ